MKLVLLSIILLTASSAFGQCPTITVIGPEGVTKIGEKMVFRAEVGIVGPKVEYHWSVSAGTIVEGQGTSSIAVHVDRGLSGRDITATVKIGGLPAFCEASASETAPVMLDDGCWLPSDEYGHLKPNDERARLDAFIAEVSNNPTHTGVVILTITTNDRLDLGNPRVRFIMKHLRYRNFDTNRVVFVLELGESRRTKLYRFVPEQKIPCDGCLIIKGGDL